MKKITVLALCLVLALGMTACGARSAPAPPEAPAATAAPTQAPATEAPATEAPAQPATEAPTQAPAEDDAVEQAKKTVLSLKGQPVQALYDALGMPTGEPEYASSCLVTGGKDGVLPYDGFTVYTLVQPDGTETVYDVE